MTKLRKNHSLWSKIAVFLLLICVSFAFVGCSIENDKEQNIEVSNSVQASFESKITVTSIEPLSGGERAVFKPSISVEDISLEGALKGKTVKSVQFIDVNTINIVLDGKVDKITEDWEYGEIIISKNALENECDAFDVVLVEKAYIVATSVMTSSASGTYLAKYSLAAGSFTADVGLEDISLAEGCDGTIEQAVVENDGRLTVKVVGATKEPTLIMDAGVTSFNKQITIAMSSLAKVVLE